MDLLEYQAKQLFREMGIPVLPSQQINHPKDLKDLKIHYPVVLKSQVYTGGRGRAGGIRFVENTIDAVAAAHNIFNLPILDMLPEVILAEAKYDADRELYLAVLLNGSARRPMLLGSRYGGIDVEAALEDMQRIIIDQEFSPFYARRLAIKMGLQGDLIQSVSAIIEKMYHLFVEKDLDLVEINPLAVSPTGELMALDGKVVVNDDGLGRHSDLSILQQQIPIRIRTKVTSGLLPSLSPVELDGDIGVLCNGAGLTMATLDLIDQASGRVAAFLNIGSEEHRDFLNTPLPERLGQGLEQLMANKQIKVVLVNILGNELLSRSVIEMIADHLKTRSPSHSSRPIVLRLVAQSHDTVEHPLSQWDIPIVEALDEAINQVVRLAQAPKS